MKKEKKTLNKLRQKAEEVKARNKNIDDGKVLKDINKNMLDKDDLNPVTLPNSSAGEYLEVH